MHSSIDWSKPRRQSRVVIFLVVLKLVKSLWPFLLLLMARSFLGGGTIQDQAFTPVFWGVLAVLVLVFVARLNDIAGFLFFRFSIVDQQLVISSGVIVKRKAEVPLSRIQAIHTVQTFLHKLTNTCKLVIDTAGTEKAEMEIEALNINIARDFQQALTAGRAELHDEKLHAGKLSQGSQQVLQLTWRDIFKLCISENHLKTFLVVLVFLLGKMQDIREYLGFDSFEWMQQHSSAANATVQAIVLVFVIGMMFSILLSCVRVVLRFYGYTVSLEPSHFVMKWGLLETREKHIPFDKVQLLSWRSNFFRRLLQMNMLRLHATAENETKEDQLIQVPVANPGHLKTITGYYQPILPADHSGSFGIRQSYVGRQVLLLGLPISIAIAVPLCFIASWYALLPAIWLAYFAISTYLYYKNFKIWISDEAIQVEKGVWGRENILVNFKNVQQVSLKSSPYKRKHQLADLVIHTTGINVHIPFLTAAEAGFMMDLILVKIEFDEAEMGSYHLETERNAAGNYPLIS